MKHYRPEWEPEADVAANISRVLPEMAKAYFRAGRKATRKKTAPEQLHEFRLSSKHFRYLLEFFAPLYGKRLTRPLESLRRIQTLLGELNDYAVTRHMMRAEAETSRLMAHLDELEAARRSEFRSYWREQFDAAGNEEQWTALLAAPAKRQAPRGQARMS